MQEPRIEERQAEIERVRRVLMGEGARYVLRPRPALDCITMLREMVLTGTDIMATRARGELSRMVVAPHEMRDAIALTIGVLYRQTVDATAEGEKDIALRFDVDPRAVAGMCVFFRGFGAYVTSLQDDAPGMIHAPSAESLALLESIAAELEAMATAEDGPGN